MTHPDASALVAALEGFRRAVNYRDAALASNRLDLLHEAAERICRADKAAVAALSAYRAQSPAPPQEEGERLCKLKKAFDAGFQASAEGWNGEYGADTDSEFYREKRAAAIRALAEEG